MRALSLAFLVACGEPAIPAKPQVDCGAPIAGLSEILHHRVILVGEMHGTAEIPRAVGDMICRASERTPVVLAIEQVPDFQAPYDAAIAKGDRSALLAAGMFAAKDQDGRASIAMADLVMRVHALRAAGRDVSLGLFDATGPNERDTRMAKRFVDVLAAHPNATTIAITGNLHAQRAVGAPWDPAFVTMGSEIAKRTPVYSIHAHGEGEAWNCIDDECAAHPLEAKWTEPLRAITPTDKPGYDAALNLGRLTASPPAVSAK